MSKLCQVTAGGSTNHVLISVMAAYFKGILMFIPLFALQMVPPSLLDLGCTFGQVNGFLPVNACLPVNAQTYISLSGVKDKCSF